MNGANFKLIALLTLIFVATLFLIQNTQVADINILIWTYSMSVSLVVVSILLIGILLGWFLKSYTVHKKKKLTEQKPIDKPKY
jgi:uncharacterized integral membrane protein